MSLINQMLKDLEERKQQGEHIEDELSVLDGIQVSRPRSRGSSKRIVRVGAVLVILAACGFAASQWFIPSPVASVETVSDTASLPVPVESEPVVLPVKPVEPPVLPDGQGPEPKPAAVVVTDLLRADASEPISDASSEAEVAVSPVLPVVASVPVSAVLPVKESRREERSPVKEEKTALVEARAAVSLPGASAVVVTAPESSLSSVRITEGAESVRLVFDLDSVPDYQVRTKKNKTTLVVELEATRLTGRLPAVPRNSRHLLNVASITEQGTLRIEVEMNSPFFYRDRVAQAQMGAGELLVLELQILPGSAPVQRTKAPNSVAKPEPEVIVSPPGKGSEAASALSRVPAGRSKAQQVALMVEQGQRALGERRGGEAESAFRQALRLDPSHVSARENLALILVRTGRTSDAERVLAEGVKRAPGHVAFRRMEARLLVNRGRWDQARTLLLAGAPPLLSEDPKYYALLAAVQQKTGFYEEAARGYRDLLELNPQAGPWWMGLGIALESSGHLPESLQAYKQALECTDLTPALVEYVTRRVQSLNASRH